MGLTNEEYQALLDKPGVARANPDLAGQGAHPVLEQDPRPGPLAAPQAEETDSSRHLPGRRVGVQITSYRVRLLDEDNLAGGAKYHVDALRYAGLIPDDGPGHISLSVTQLRVAKRKHERTEIRLTYALPEK